MKTFTLFYAFLALLPGPGTCVTYEVAQCSELADVDDQTVTSLVITASPFECDKYTRFRVRNSMTLTASVSEVYFSNFALKVLGELTVSPDVVFTGVVEQVVNGGALSVEEGATVTFEGTSEFRDNSVLNRDIGPISCGDDCILTKRGVSYIVKKGGAIHNKGDLTFKQDATFVGNWARTVESGQVTSAGAISNTATGKISFEGDLTVLDNEAEDGFGGGIFSRGEITVDGEAVFSGNEGGIGGGIYQTRVATSTFNGMVNFTRNSGDDFSGGAVQNVGGVMYFNDGGLFDRNRVNCNCEVARGGAIFNEGGGQITLKGSTTFTDNSAFPEGAAIFNDIQDDDPAVTTTTYPSDTVFEGNEADDCPNVFPDDCGPLPEDDY